MADQNIGKVVQVIGPVLDVEFDPESLPEIYNAISVQAKNEAGQDIDLVAEVQQHIGRGQVRAVSMSSTDGVTRGMEAVDTGAAITVPVGKSGPGGGVLASNSACRLSKSKLSPYGITSTSPSGCVMVMSVGFSAV